jgi:hypothetical protein
LWLRCEGFAKGCKRHENFSSTRCLIGHAVRSFLLLIAAANRFNARAIAATTAVKLRYVGRKMRLRAA